MKCRYPGCYEEVKSTLNYCPEHQKPRKSLGQPLGQPLDFPVCEECGKYLKRGDPEPFCSECVPSTNPSYRPRKRDAIDEQRFRAWVQQCIADEQYISYRFASQLVSAYAEMAKIPFRYALKNLRDWGLKDVIVSAPWSTEFLTASPEERDVLRYLWGRRDFRDNPTSPVEGFRRNPTVFAAFYRLEHYLKQAVSTYLAAKPGDNYTIRHVIQLLKAIQQSPGTFTADEFADLMVENAGVIVPLASSSYKKSYRPDSFFEEELPVIGYYCPEAGAWLVKAKNEITNIIHYFIQQHVINRPKLTIQLQNLKDIIELILQDAQAGAFLSQDGSFDYMTTDEFALLENDMAILNKTDPYMVNLLSFHNIIVAQRGVDSQTLRYIAYNAFPLIAYSSVDPKDEPGKKLLHKRCVSLIKEMDAFLRLLCPFKNVAILSLRDLTGMKNIFVKYQPQQAIHPMTQLGDRLFF